MAGLFAASGTACSLILKFDEEGRPCGKPETDDPEERGTCLEGWSCLIDECVRLNSVAHGQTCSDNEQCKSNLCVAFICRERCDYPFGDEQCSSASDICVPMTGTDDARAGGCVPSDCTEVPCKDVNGDEVIDAADVGTACVQVKPAASLCMDACTIVCAGAACAGDCTPTVGLEPRACQPLGSGPELACVLEGTRTQGDACNQLDFLCDNQHACMMLPGGNYGLCLKYCNPAELIPCDGVVDPKTGQSPADCNPLGGTGASVCGTAPQGPPPDDGGPTGDGDPGPPRDECEEACGGSGECQPGYACVGQRCVECSSSPECVGHASLWSTVDAAGADGIPDAFCTTDAQCTPSVCVVYNSQNWCAPVYVSGACANHGTPQDLAKAEGGTASICVNDSHVCENNACVWRCTTTTECIVRNTLWWTTVCVDDTACNALAFEVCIDIGGNGRCAVDSVAAAGCTLGSPVTMPHITGVPASGFDVCGNDLTCDVDVCVPDPLPGCTIDAECLDPAYPTCDSPPGTCVCSGSSCNNASGHPSCNLGTGLCECELAVDCTAGLSLTHPGTTWVCQ